MSSTLVLKRFRINPNDKDEPLVDIEGRSGGLISFLLSLIQVDPTTYLRAYNDHIEFRQVGLSGEQSITIPLSAVSGISGGNSKPFKLLVTAGISLLTGLPGLFNGIPSLFWVGLIISGILCLIYSLKKEMNLHIQNGGDKLWGLTFQRSVIENIPINDVAVKKAIFVINKAVLDTHNKNKENMNSKY
jgi:hypothetical protein